MGDNQRKLCIMTSQSLFLFFPLLARCLGQENPCEDISLGSCIVEEESILNTYSAPPDKCSKLCDVNPTCMFWRSRWDGTLCYLLTSDYQQDCGSFAGAINWIDCNEGPDSCYAYSDDDCVYTGDRMEAEEPFPEAVTSIEGCRLWAEVYSSVGAAFFHYNSTSEECHLYRTLDAECQAVGGPKAAPGFDQCTEKTTTTSPFVPTTTTTTTTTTSVSEPTNGILVIGGNPSSQSVEFWSAAEPEQGSCVLNDYPRQMWDSPTVNLVSGHLVACYEDTCEIYREGSWQHLQDTTASRTLHSSATREDAVLLIGGDYSYSTEWIAVDGSAAKPGPFTVRHGHLHCTIQLSDDIIVVTGGWQTEAFVTEYHLEDGTETALTPLGQPRWVHACGVYLDADGQQVLIITGGADGSRLTSTEVAINTGGGSQLEWRETGRLPTGRYQLRAAVIDNHIYVTGGQDYNYIAGYYNYLTEILRWDPSSESWQQVGNLGVGRDGHAALAIPSSIIESECSAMFLK